VKDRLTIDQVAGRVGMTVRNIRAHQTRGLLPPPELAGRTGYYGAEHVARLELIKDMQSSGFNLNAIRKLLDRTPVGAGEDVLRFERALMAPWDSEEPMVFGAEELAGLLGGEIDEALATRALELGVIVDLGDGRFEAPSPALIRAGAQVVAMGIPAARVLDTLERLMAHADGVAAAFVDLFLEDIWKPFEREGSPEGAWSRVNNSLEQLRPIASEVLLAAFHHTMGRAVEEAFGERLHRSEDGAAEAG
jgi:DNA-binding transcriptional MerR regulator